MAGEATFGDYGTHGGSVSLTGPIVDEVLAGRLYVAARRRDGLYDVKAGEGPRTSTDDQTEYYNPVRGQLLRGATPNPAAPLTCAATEPAERCLCCAQDGPGAHAPQSRA